MSVLTALPSRTSSVANCAPLSAGSWRAAWISVSVAPVASTLAPSARKPSAIAAPMPEVPPVMSAWRPRKRPGLRASAAFRDPSANELVDIVRAETDLHVVRPTQIDLRENVLESEWLSVSVAIVHDAIDLKVGDHLLDIVGDDERVSLPWRLEYVSAFLGDPVMFQIVPASLEHEAVHRLRMAVAAQHAGLAHFEEVHPIPLRPVEAERAEPYVLALRHPNAVVDGDRVRDHEIRQRLLWHRILVGHSGIGIDLHRGHLRVLNGGTKVEPPTSIPIMQRFSPLFESVMLEPQKQRLRRT